MQQINANMLLPKNLISVNKLDNLKFETIIIIHSRINTNYMSPLTSCDGILPDFKSSL